MPEDESVELQEAAALVTYGWGRVPVQARIGAMRWTTSLFSKNGGYVAPLKDVVRNGEKIDVGDVVTISLHVDV